MGYKCINLARVITAIPEPDANSDAVLCNEVLEHIPEPTHALDEFTRLPKPSGVMILTALFGSYVHKAPSNSDSGFPKTDMNTIGDKAALLSKSLPQMATSTPCYHEMTRLGGLERSNDNWSRPLGNADEVLGVLYFKLRGNQRSTFRKYRLLWIALYGREDT